MKTILNKKNVDTTKQPLFLGEDLALQRYEKPKYEVFLKLFRDQITQFWTPEEINLGLCSAEFKALSNHEKHIFTKNLQFQTLMDSVIARGVPSLTEHVSNPELEVCLSAWQFFENIHSYAYTYIIKNVYSNPTEIMDGVLEDEEILARCDSVSREYDRLRECSKGDLKKQIYLTLVSINILEAIRFYVSFVCAFAFANNKKMVGNADVIRLIKRDEACVSGDTEVLTPTGWVRFDQLEDGVKVAQYNSDETIEFVLPNKVIRKDYDGELVNIRNTIGHIDMMLTPDHRVIFEKVMDGSLAECEAQNFNGNHTKRVIVACNKNGKRNNLSIKEKILIALQADGNILNKSSFRFEFKKKRKIDKIESILNDFGKKYSKNISKRGTTVFLVGVQDDIELTKNLYDWINLEDVSTNWCQEFINEVVCWDGHSTKDMKSFFYCSIDKKNVDLVQAIASIAGYKTHTSYLKYGENKQNKMHQVNIYPNKRTQSGQSLFKTNIPYSGKVYCVSVPSGMFLARRNNGIFVTGNCHLNITQTIIKILRTVPEEGFQETIQENQNQAIEMFKFAVEEEKAWAKYLFKDGSILGLNYDIISQYIEWLADSRLEQLDLPKQYNIKRSSIGGWITPWMNSESVQVAPQESEITSYRISASKSDISTEDFSDINL